MDVRASRRDRLGDARQRARTVDEQLDAVAVHRREGTRFGPVARARIERVPVAVAAQASPVVRGDRALDRVAEHVIETIEGYRQHDWSFCSPPTAINET